MGCAMPGSIHGRCGSPAAGEGSTSAGVHRVNGNNQEDTHRTVERVARESYGRLVAYLSVHTHDLASAEDALSNALVSALNHASGFLGTPSCGVVADSGAPFAH